MSMKSIGISNVLFSKSQQQVLGLLYGQPDKDFYTNEIIRLTNAGTGAVQRELVKFTRAGFISMKQVGNQKRYQANQAMPFYFELRSIILKTFGLADVIIEALKPISHKIKFGFVYGSIAQLEDTANSDVDLMVITDNLTFSDLFQRLSKAEIKLSRKINPTCYSVSEWQRKLSEENHFVSQVMRQPKIFLIGSEHGLEAIRKSGKNGTAKS